MQPRMAAAAAARPYGARSRYVQVPVLLHVLLHALPQLCTRRRVPIEQAFERSASCRVAGLRGSRVKVPRNHTQPTAS